MNTPLETAAQLIVFDMDGVLIDVSASYRETVRQTARLFFKGARSWQALPDPLFSLRELAQIKQSGGLNNDWDLTFEVIRRLMVAVDLPHQTSADADPWRVYEKFIAGCDVGGLARRLCDESRPLTKLAEGTTSETPSAVSRFYEGDVGSGNIVKQIFQELYLGQNVFESHYRLPARIHQGAGYNQHEEPIFTASQLAELADRHTLAVATGRPRAEAEFALEHFELRPFFQWVLTLDDCLREQERHFQRSGQQRSFSKPDPFILDQIAARVAFTPSRRVYIGDMPDDMQAAAKSRLGFVGVGMVATAENPKRLARRLRAAGAAAIMANAAELLRWVAT